LDKKKRKKARYSVFRKYIHFLKPESAFKSKKKKRKILPAHTIKTYRASGSKAALLVKLGKQPQCPLNSRLGGSHSLFGRFGEGKNLLYLPGFDLRFAYSVA
jgi:hypothetical protein